MTSEEYARPLSCDICHGAHCHDDFGKGLYSLGKGIIFYSKVTDLLVWNDIRRLFKLMTSDMDIVACNLDHLFLVLLRVLQ